MKTVNSIIALLALSCSPAEATVLQAEAAYNDKALGKIDKYFTVKEDPRKDRKVLTKKCCVANGDFIYFTWYSKAHKFYSCNVREFSSYYKWMGIPLSDDEEC